MLFFEQHKTYEINQHRDTCQDFTGALEQLRLSRPFRPKVGGPSELAEINTELDLREPRDPR